MKLMLYALSWVLKHQFTCYPNLKNDVKGKEVPRKSSEIDVVFVVAVIFVVALVLMVIAAVVPLFLLLSGVCCMVPLSNL